MSIQVKKVGELFDMKLGKMLSGKNYTGKNLRPYLRNLNVQWGRIDFNDVKQMDFDKEDFERYQLKKGDILVCEGGEVGRTAIYNGEIANCCYQNALHRLRPKNGSILPEYFVSYMSFAAQTGLIQKQTSSVTIAHFTAEKFREFEIPLPDLKTQQKIADTLEQADTARQKRKQANQLTEEFLQSTFLEMFGDPVRNEKGWEVKKVESFVSKIISGWSAPSENREKTKGEFGVLKVSAVTYGVFIPEENKAVRKEDIKQKMVHPMKGDVLMTRANTQEFVAACCIVEKDYNDLFLSDKHWKIEIDQKQIVPWYFKFVISSDSFHQVLSNKSTGTGGSMFNISKDKLLNTNFSIPPLTEQKKFASLVAQTEKLRNKQRESERELENLFQSLMQRYFG